MILTSLYFHYHFTFFLFFIKASRFYNLKNQKWSCKWGGEKNNLTDELSKIRKDAKKEFPDLKSWQFFLFGAGGRLVGGGGDFLDKMSVKKKKDFPSKNYLQKSFFYKKDLNAIPTPFSPRKKKAKIETNSHKIAKIFNSFSKKKWTHSLKNI